MKKTSTKSTKPSKPKAPEAARKPSRDEPAEAREEQPSKLSFEGLLARDEAAAYFDALIGGLRKGQIKFRRGSQALTLAPVAHVEVEVKASRKSGKEKLAFEMSWTVPSAHDLEIG